MGGVRSMVWVVAGSLGLAACGGGGSDGGTAATEPANGPVVSIGRIDAFGSVFVNGVEYETDRATYRVDDRAEFSDGALAVGMIVRLRGTSDGQGRGSALEIRYDDEVEGLVRDLAVDPADASVKRFTVLGQNVLANSATVFRGRPGVAFAFADLSNGDHVEVSGDFDGTTLIASFIKLEDGADDDFEAKGVVSNLNGSMFVLTLRGGATLNVTLAASAVLPGGLADGSFVEVEGTIPDATRPRDLLARRIELEDREDLDGDGDRDRDERELDLEGVLSLAGTKWSVRDTELRFLAGTEYRPATLAADITAGTAAGKRVRVRGPVVDGVLQVERIRLDGVADGADQLEVKGFVEKVTTNSDGTTTVQLSFAPATGTLDVVVNADTLLVNDDGVAGVDLTRLTPDVSFVEVHGRLEAGKFVAGVFEIEDRPEEYEVEGPLDANGFVANVSISALGIRFMLDSGTVFEDGTPSAGRVVDVEDLDRDGFADTVDIED
jgi:hypothetical protein